MILNIENSRHKKIEYFVDNNNCWICTSHCKDKDGYPKIGLKYKSMRMPRYIYSKLVGEIPEGFVIRHKCDNPQCINPEHLEVGTQYDNIMDKVKRGRMSENTLKNLILGRGLKGEKSPCSKLTEQQVREILQSNLKHREIAEIYNISRRYVGQIKQRRSWAHITL